MPNNKSYKTPVYFILTIFLIVGSFGGGLLIGLTKRPEPTDPNTVLDTELINNVYQLVKQEYIKDLPNKDQLTRGMIKGFIEALDDTYSAYLTPEEAKEYLAAAGSQFEGIGVQLGFNGEYTYVESVFEGSPAQKNGVTVGDVVLQVDDKDVAGQRPELVATKIRGKAGTQVKIKFFRANTQKAVDVNITRAQIDLDNISYKQLENGVIVIDIRKFTEAEEGNSNGVQVFNREWDKVVKEVVALKPKAVVIDLRSNPGGYVDSVRYVAEEFLKNGQVVMREFDRRSGEKVYTDGRAGELESIPVTVLVDSGSASASEILAAALQDNNRGKIIGVKTVGKGVEQKLMPVQDGSLLILVFRSWLTPNGKQISKEQPIQPDFEVEYKKDNNAKYDSQMLKALEVLQAK
jgi:carboxyl-terminal processing protease